mmetsp:Transcript_42968/g.118831  ORF Transcript_42968/g.118831 Transcript_42968/m.118831 type:complete len:146 (-) Transcript_42968:199-636(-)
MAQPEIRQYNQYQPPMPMVFGSSLDIAELPMPAPGPSHSRSLHREHRKTRLSHQERLAIYDDDNPWCQDMLCCAGFLCPLLWMIGAAMYLRTPTTKTLTRHAGVKNMVLSVLTAVVLACVLLLQRHYVGEDTASGDTTGLADGAR